MADAAGRSQFKFINALLLACKCVTALPPADSEIMPLYILPAFSKAASVTVPPLGLNTPLNPFLATAFVF
jgi:hypothetical protein